MDDALISLGVLSERKALPGGLSLFHLLLWKFTVIAFVQVDTEHAEFKPEDIWKAAVSRTQNKIIARHTYLCERDRKLFNLGKNVVPLDSETHAEPLAYFEREDPCEVHIHYSVPFRDLLAELGILTSTTT